MMRFVLTSLLLGFAVTASAQTLSVQSGDHVGFTRLVIRLGAERDWTLFQEDPRTWIVSTAPEVDGFDLSGAFDLIQRNRLADLTNGSSLSLNLACDCQVDAFRHQGQYLVIDIADPDPNAQVVLPEEEEVFQIESRQRSADALPDLASLLRGPNQLPDLSVPVDLATEAAVDEQPEPIEPQPNPRLAEAAEIMAEQLARAAASGLLDASLGQPQTFADPVSTTPPAMPNPVEEAPLAPTDIADEGATPSPHPERGELPVRTQTALDPAIALETPLTPPGEEEACQAIPFNARDWADASRFEHGLGEHRLALYDDRDVLEADGARDLALYYLYHGFGAEARYWLTQLPEPPEDLLHVADLVDGAETAAFDPVSSPADCSQGELLWRYLAGAVSVDLTTDDLAAIQRAYSELPIHLRDLMGLRLARQLHADRHGPAARNVRDILYRGGRVDDGVLRLLDLDLGLPLAASDTETRNALTDMLAGGGSDPVSTMAQAMAFDRSAGILPEPERLVAAEALLREAGAGSDTDALWQEILLAHAALGAPDIAFAMLAETQRTAQAREAALTDLITERVAVGDTASLLVLAYTFGAEWRPQGSEAGRAQVAAIALLREEGLYQAAQILRDVRRPLILPAQDDPNATSPDPVLIAWESADWAELSELGNGAHAEVADRMEARAEAQDGAATAPQDLAGLSAAISDSRTLRDTIGTLLAQPTPE